MNPTPVCRMRSLILLLILALLLCGGTVNLVRPDQVPAFREEISRRYHKATGLKPDIIPLSPAGVYKKSPGERMGGTGRANSLFHITLS